MKQKIDWCVVIRQCRHPEKIWDEFELVTLTDYNSRNNYINGGKTPRYDRGEAIVDYWMRCTGKTYDQLPREPR